MSNATDYTYPESVGSCRPPSPTPPTSPPPHPAPAAAPRGGPVRRQLDFGDADAGAGSVSDLDEDEDDFLIRAADYIEAKRRAPPCVCGRGNCAVEQDEQRNHWVYVCTSQPKCRHVSLCKEVDLNPQSPPIIRSDPKLGNPCVLNIPSTHVADATTPVNNVDIQGADATAPINVSPHAAVASTPFKYTSQGVGAATAIPVSLQGAGDTKALKVSDESPICRCTAGKCKILRVGNEDFYVCPIRKGQGACSYKLPLVDAVQEQPEIGDNKIMGDNDLKDNPVDKEARGNNIVLAGGVNANGSANPAQPNDDEWPFDTINDEIVPTVPAAPQAKVYQESPSMPRQPIAVAKTPTKSPMTVYGARSPMTPRPNNVCYGCGEEGHWVRDCPKPRGHLKQPCFKCGMVGHYQANCPQPRGPQKQ